MSIAIISDIHINSKNDPAYRELIALLDQHSKPGDRWVLNGDIFELFVGSKSWFLNEYSELIEKLKMLSSSGVSVDYIEGNHDFQLDLVFNRESGVKLHDHSVEIKLGNKNLMVAHGDLIDTKDLAYRAWRSGLRTPVARWLIEKVPSKWIEEVGEKSSRMSQARREFWNSDKAKERVSRTRNLFREFAKEKMNAGFDFVVLGHSHDLDEERVQIGNRWGHYMNMGYPKENRSYIILEEGSDFLVRKSLPSL